MTEKDKYRILLVNKFYYPRGGDCIQMMNLERLLKSKGHQVAVFSMQYPQNIESEYSHYFIPNVDFTGGLRGKMKASARIFGFGDVKAAFVKILDDFKPDIVHLHNIHSYISPLVAKLAKKRGCRVIWTLHDYKLACPSYSCLSKGKPCEACWQDKTAVIKKRCMKKSRLASAFAYIESKVWNIKRLCRYTDVFICPSSFMAGMMSKAGIPDDKLVTLCNFIDDKKLVSLTGVNKDEREDYYCYVGRISEEKGLRTLLKVASELPYTLKIAGTGPLLDGLRTEYNSDNIVFLGHLDRTGVLRLLSKAKCSVIPSEWYDNNPLSIIESLSMGTPVIGANIGGIPELINVNNGLLFSPSDCEDLRSKINEFFFNKKYDNNMVSEKALSLYNSDIYYNEIAKIYALN